MMDFAVDGPGDPGPGDSNWVSEGPSAINGGLADATSPKGNGEKPQKPKVRKQYTISKQRERWTDEEHNRFLDALKLYGRAWRRIEEHIGTKTAVQIRSHAQKFFAKLEKEQNAGLKGEGLPEDLAIPPPRPKRKPAHPYPKKANGSVASGLEHAPSMQISNQQQQQQQQQVHFPDFAAMAADGEVGEATVAAVAAAASAAAAAAAAAVVAAAGEQVQAQLQASPPQGFPFFGLPPSMLATLGMRSNAVLGSLRASGHQMPQHHHHHHRHHSHHQHPQRMAHQQPALGGRRSGGQERTATSEPGVPRRPPLAVGRGSDGDSACSAESSMDGKEATRKMQGDAGATSTAMLRQAKSMQTGAIPKPSWLTQPAARAHSQGAIPADWSLANAPSLWAPAAPANSGMHPVSLHAPAAFNAAAASYWGMSQQAYANMPPIAGVLVDQPSSSNPGHSSRHQHMPSSSLTNLANAARLAERSSKLQREMQPTGTSQQDNGSDGSGTDNNRKATDAATTRKADEQHDSSKYAKAWRAAQPAGEAGEGYEQPIDGYDPEAGEGSGSNPTGNGGSSGDGSNGNANGSSGNGSGNGISVKDSNNGNGTSGVAQVGSCATKDGAAVGSGKAAAPTKNTAHAANGAGGHKHHHSHLLHTSACADALAAAAATETGSNPACGSGQNASNPASGSGGNGSNGSGGPGAHGSDEGRSALAIHPSHGAQAAGVSMATGSGQQTLAYGSSDSQTIQAATAAALQQAGGLQRYFLQSSYNPQLARLQQQALMQWGASASPFEVHNVFGNLFANMQGYLAQGSAQTGPVHSLTPIPCSMGLVYDMPKHEQMPSAAERTHSAPPAPSAPAGSQPLREIREDALPTPAEVLGQQGFKPYRTGSHGLHSGHALGAAAMHQKRPHMTQFSNLEPQRKAQRTFPAPGNN